jgi:hypothetical protein
MEDTATIFCINTIKNHRIAVVRNILYQSSLNARYHSFLHHTFFKFIYLIACNVKIFQAEHFIPQLLCLTWDPHMPTRELAKEVASRLHPPTPPSLLDITRAKIRQCPSLHAKSDLYEEVKAT